MTQKRAHTFHIPVMGTAFTVDSPVKVAPFGIASVISIGDDELCEAMRESYLRERGQSYEKIEKFSDDFRARRITAYLNLVDILVDEKIEAMKAEIFGTNSDLDKYFTMLPEGNSVKAAYELTLSMSKGSEKDEAEASLKASMVKGSIDVNIMTKLDRDNFDKNNEPMETKFSDALASLRGYADSTLRSGIVFSAGFNRRLYAYIETFKDFFPDELGDIKKRVIMKVSDYRSSLTQGKFLAKKGVWISEHRIESGLNCGGHAFASDGFLLGPIMAEFKDSKETLTDTLLDVCNTALEKGGKPVFSKKPETLITVQGGIGTHSEDSFLLDHFKVDGTGWASPFLLVPEATILDDKTRELLMKANEDDFYLSGVSPLGVPFNTVKGTASEGQKLERFDRGRPGSPCPKGYLVSNKEYSKKPVCTASVFFQKRKIEELKKSITDNADQLKEAIRNVIDKVCLCEDLAASSLIINKLENKRPLSPAVCPGPNLAYFSKIASLKEMVEHIYGRLNLLNDTYRQNMFIKELSMYVDHLGKEIKAALPSPTEKKIKFFNEFKSNLEDGIQFYKELIPNLTEETQKYRDRMFEELYTYAQDLDNLFEAHTMFFKPQVK